MARRSVFREDILAGRVALITGGGTGIGFGIASSLGLHGCKVVIMGRRMAFLDDAVEKLRQVGIKASAIAGDVRKEEDAKRAVDFTIATAAGNFLAPAENLSLNAFNTVIQIDTIGVFNMCRQSFAPLKASGDGVILNITATLHYGATWWQSHPSAAKAAIDSLTRSLALEWGTYGIRVNGIAPGPIADTPGVAKLSGGLSNEDLEKLLAENVPLGRAGKTTNIGDAAVFLVSAAASFVTGDTLVCDGGAWMGHQPSIPREVVTQVSRKVESGSRAVKAKL